MGCQGSIASKIIDKQADFVIALRSNQGSLHEDVELLVTEQKATGFQDTTISHDQTIDGDHGRIETGTTTAIHDVDWLQERHAWPSLKGRARLTARSRMRRFSTSPHWLSRPSVWADRAQPLAVENTMHWVMDMTFRDDGGPRPAVLPEQRCWAPVRS
jgi:predicted transposase YbfD/YdcC